MGLVDLSVVLCELGYGCKGNVESEICVVVVGGIISLCCLFYIWLVLDILVVVELIFDCVCEVGNVKVYFIGVLICGFGGE